MAEQSAQNQDKFIVRLPDGLRDRIRLAAESNHRSMNAEVVALLEENSPRASPGKHQRPRSPNAILARQTNPTEKPATGLTQRQASRPIRAHCGRYFGTHEGYWGIALVGHPLVSMVAFVILPIQRQPRVANSMTNSAATAAPTVGAAAGAVRCQPNSPCVP